MIERLDVSIRSVIAVYDSKGFEWVKDYASGIAQNNSIFSIIILAGSDEAQQAYDKAKKAGIDSLLASQEEFVEKTKVEFDKANAGVENYKKMKNDDYKKTMKDKNGGKIDGKH